MLIICQIDWREVGVAFELQCLRNCTLSSFLLLNGWICLYSVSVPKLTQIVVHCQKKWRTT